MTKQVRFFCFAFLQLGHDFYRSYNITIILRFTILPPDRGDVIIFVCFLPVPHSAQRAVYTYRRSSGSLRSPRTTTNLQQVVLHAYRVLIVPYITATKSLLTWRTSIIIIIIIIRSDRHRHTPMYTLITLITHPDSSSAGWLNHRTDKYEHVEDQEPPADDRSMPNNHRRDRLGRDRP